MAQSGTRSLLFTDIVNSTVQLQQAGDEAGQRLFRTHHKLTTEAIGVNGGEELQWLGDGVLAAFSSVADAVRCAIQIQQAARRPIEGIRFEIRIGIHVGEVSRRDGGYFGTPIVIARRLCDRASSGQILCSRVVAELLASRQSFTFRELAALELKGIGAVGVAEVIYQGTDPALLLNHTPFVGRSEQMHQLSVKLEEASTGQGSIVILQGEAGIGKTRTIEEFADLALQHRAMVLRGACYDGEWQPPYGPFAEAVLDLAHHPQVADCSDLVAKCAPIVARIAPALRTLFDKIAEPVALDKEEERLRLFDAVAQLFVAASMRATLVLVLDDLHWADRGAAAMLSHVARFVSANSILLLCAFRDAEVDRKHPLSAAIAAITRQPNTEQLMLKGLGGEDLTELLGIVGDAAPPETLVKALIHETEGNPLFIREVLLHLLEEGKILHEGHRWISKVSLEELGILEGARQVISRRLVRLSDEANRLLSVASAFNGSFSFDVAAAVAELDEQTALGALDEALNAQLLRPGANAELFDFTHALIRHTLYSGLNSVRRVRWHRKIAEQMERTWGERVSSHAAEVAFHFWRGAAKSSGTQPGANYAIAAADNAEAAFDHDEVAAFLRIALELLARDDPRRPRILGRCALALAWTLNGDDALKFALEAGELIVASEGTEAAADYYEQAARTMQVAGITRGAWALAREGLRLIGDRQDIVWASLYEIDISRKEAEDPDNPGIRIDSPEYRELYQVLKRLPRKQLWTRNFDRSFATRDELNRDPDPSATSLLMLAGDYSRCLPMHQHDAIEAEQHGAIARATRAWADVARCHTSLGDFTEARAALDRALKLSARMANTAVPSFALLTLVAARGELHYATDDGWTEMLTDSAASTFIKDAGPEGKWASAMINAYVSYLFAQINQPDLAIQRVSLLLPALELGALWARTYCSMACIAAATVWMLNRSEHVDAIERSIRLKVLAPDFRAPMSDSRLSFARLCALKGRYDEACDWFSRARDVLDQQGARPLRAIADFDEALMHLRRGAAEDAERAGHLLDTASEQFARLEMTGWLRRAQATASPAS